MHLDILIHTHMVIVIEAYSHTTLLDRCSGSMSQGVPHKKQYTDSHW